MGWQEKGGKYWINNIAEFVECGVLRKDPSGGRSTSYSLIER